jgi:hypothetical protein
MNFNNKHMDHSIAQRVCLQTCWILFTACLLAVGSVTASQGPATDSDNSSAVIQGPAPGTRGDEGLLGLDPWTVITPMPFAVSRPGGTFLDGLFYVIGGEGPGARVGRVQIYDPATDTWDAASADTMPAPVSNLCAAAVGGLIYVPGGRTDIAPINQL